MKFADCQISAMCLTCEKQLFQKSEGSRVLLCDCKERTIYLQVRKIFKPTPPEGSLRRENEAPIRKGG